MALVAAKEGGVMNNKLKCGICDEPIMISRGSGCFNHVTKRNDDTPDRDIAVNSLGRFYNHYWLYQGRKIPCAGSTRPAYDLINRRATLAATRDGEGE